MDFDGDWDESFFAAADDIERQIHQPTDAKHTSNAHVSATTTTADPWAVDDDLALAAAMDKFEQQAPAQPSVPRGQQVFVSNNGDMGMQQGPVESPSQPESHSVRKPLDPCTGLDEEAAKTWVYPTNLPIRDYQYNICERALLNNTLVCLPTGLGKTFIGAVVMFNYFRWYPTGKIVFMAPTKPLVNQQIDACRNITYIPRACSIEMTGGILPAQRKKYWAEKRVFFVTPQVLVNDISQGACKSKDIVCLVIDEAHRAAGRHAYCTCVQQIIVESNRFRILALTATPGKDLTSVQNVINNLKISHVEIRDENDIDVQPYVHSRSVESITVALDANCIMAQRVLFEIMKIPISNLVRSKVFYEKDPSRVFTSALLSSRTRFRNNPPPNLRGQNAASRTEADFAVAIKIAHALLLLRVHGLEPLRAYLESLKRTEKGRRMSIVQQDLICSMPFRTLVTDINKMMSQGVPSHPKLVRLVELIVAHFNSEGSTRVIIFTSYRDSVGTIIEALNKQMPLVKAMSFVGQAVGRSATKGLTQRQQAEVINQFRSGGYNTLVSTSIGEEGLDIGEVDLIVCYDAPSSPIRLVQRMGRTGRKRRGRIVYLITEGYEEAAHRRTLTQKKSFGKYLLESIRRKALLLYDNNHRMLPDTIKPKVAETVMEPDPMSPPYEPPKQRVRARTRGDNRGRGAYIVEDGEIDAASLAIDRAVMQRWIGYQAVPSPVFQVPHSRKTLVLISVIQKCRDSMDIDDEGGLFHVVEPDAFSLSGSQASHHSHDGNADPFVLPSPVLVPESLIPSGPTEPSIHLSQASVVTGSGLLLPPLPLSQSQDALWSPYEDIGSNQPVMKYEGEGVREGEGVGDGVREIVEESVRDGDGVREGEGVRDVVEESVREGVGEGVVVVIEKSVRDGEALRDGEAVREDGDGPTSDVFDDDAIEALMIGFEGEGREKGEEEEDNRSATHDNLDEPLLPLHVGDDSMPNDTQGEERECFCVDESDDELSNHVKHTVSSFSVSLPKPKRRKVNRVIDSDDEGYHSANARLTQDDKGDTVDDKGYHSDEPRSRGRKRSAAAAFVLDEAEESGEGSDDDDDSHLDELDSSFIDDQTPDVASHSAAVPTQAIYMQSLLSPEGSGPFRQASHRIGGTAYRLAHTKMLQLPSTPTHSNPLIDDKYIAHPPPPSNPPAATPLRPDDMPLSTVVKQMTEDEDSVPLSVILSRRSTTPITTPTTPLKKIHVDVLDPPPPLRIEPPLSKRQVVLDTSQCRSTLAVTLRTVHSCRVLVHSLDCADVAFGHVGILRRRYADFVSRSNCFSKLPGPVGVLCSTYSIPILIVEDDQNERIDTYGVSDTAQRMISLAFQRRDDVHGAQLRLIHTTSIEHTATIIASLSDKYSAAFGEISETKSKQAEFLECIPHLSTTAALALSNEPLMSTLNRPAKDFVTSGILTPQAANAVHSFMNREFSGTMSM